MSRVETVVYECDWCKERVPADYRTEDGEMPKDWKRFEYSDLCPKCQAARKQALADVAHWCLNQEPWKPVDLPPYDQRAARNACTEQKGESK